jgi:hypothetical protein
MDFSFLGPKPETPKLHFSNGERGNVSPLSMFFCGKNKRILVQRDLYKGFSCTKDSLLENWLKVAIFKGENYGPHARP